jgi:hypothetical protein
VSRIANTFRDALAVRLTESQRIGIDYANTYGPIFGQQTHCASHDYYDLRQGGPHGGPEDGTSSP